MFPFEASELQVITPIDISVPIVLPPKLAPDLGVKLS